MLYGQAAVAIKSLPGRELNFDASGRLHLEPSIYLERQIKMDHRLSPLKKIDLKFNYEPGAAGGDAPAKRSVPDSKLLHRNEWYEVLYFVNKFANEKGGGNANVALKAERLIKMNTVPTDRKSVV